MSHYVLIAALPPGSNVDAELTTRLAKYDEGLAVLPYRDYEESAPEDFWWYRSIQGDAKAVAENDHSVLKAYDPNTIGISSASSRETPGQQWEKIVADAEIYNSLPTPITWGPLVAAYNAKYPSDDPLLYDADTDAAYTYSTYNPDSRWDWYQVGGRWSYYFPYKTDLDYQEEHHLIFGNGWPRGEVEFKPFHCEGGEKRLLDLEKLRADKENEAALEYDKYKEFSADYPAARPWSTYVDEFADLPNGKDKWAVRDRVREVYNAQPLIAALNAHPNYRFAFECLVEKFSVERGDYLAAARRDAVPGFALLTLDGQWVAPGKMGMFGVSDDTPEGRAEFKDWANTYIDSLPEDTLLVAVDLHI